ncbi:hypothetical protein VP01_1411g4 [Puccinia sorghi]|uniref:Uncharacterized protein n=1 Tax=Puccinia sorghi TaxID=27349 RepID=A0A0L6VLD4_9BASI|nr:hypothetical protein VP01_1411g4 [Puccinia sorghi]
MAGHLHRGFPIFRNPINPNEGIILSSSAVTIWAEAIIHEAPGVNLTHPPSTLNYCNLKKRKERESFSRSNDHEDQLHIRCKQCKHQTSKQLEKKLDTYYDVGADVTIKEYIEFCQYDPSTCYDALNTFCKEQFINNYHLFGTDLVVNCLLNDYNVPCGLVASLRDNVDCFTEYLQSRSDVRSDDNQADSCSEELEDDE